MKKSVIITLVLFLLLMHVYAQRTTIYIEQDRDYKTALDLFDKKKYNAAIKAFDAYSSQLKNQNTLVGIDAKYYAAACAIELFHKDGEWRMKEFIFKHPESNKVKLAYFYLGKSNFRKKKYAETIEYLEKVDKYDLEKEDVAEMLFKRGYSYLETGKKNKAKADFYDIKDVDNKYAHPANYYYSHIAYTEKNYSIALEGFTRLLNDETFGSVVPYYIVQIYFLQAKYEDVIKVAPPLLNDTSYVQKKNEINRIIGESYFKLKDYAKAIPYLLKKGASSAEDHYQLGFAYYQTNDCNAAVSYFENAATNNDSLAQSALYHAAGCYLKLKEKTKARSAFFNAQNLDFDKTIKEESMFNFAVLSYEQGFSPYNEAIKAFQKYISEYPNSTQKDEAYNYLVNCFYSTKNYTQAIATIEKINSPDIKLKNAYQKMTFFKGIEFYNNLDLDSARKYFTKAQNLNNDIVISAQAAYWNAEINYLKREYAQAIENYKKFQLLPGSYELKEYDISNYNIGYCYYQLKGDDNYTNAHVSFRKYLLATSADDAMKIADANVRTGDCYYVTKVFASASEYYGKAIALNKIDVDYAIYQKAMCDGLLKNHQEKINGLKKLETNYPKSVYISSVTFEIAEAYKAIGGDDNAIAYYKKTLEKYPNSSKTEDCLMSIGLIYYKNKQDDKAFEYFDKIVKEYPNSEKIADAKANIKNIFIAKNDPESLEKYFGGAVEQNVLDVQYFEKARKYYYDDKNCDLAFPEMQKYIAKFPEGKYILNANFCMAECAYSKENYTEALKGYEFVITKQRSIYSEIALQKASYIYFKNKNYEKSLPLYMKLQEFAESGQNKLAGKIGAMRSSYYLKLYDEAIEEANKVINTEKITSQQIVEAKNIHAKSLCETNRRDEAIADLKYLIKNAKSEVGAEAYYLLAETQYLKKEYKEVEKTANNLFNYPYSTLYWNTKAMLLMADVYLDKNEEQNAEAVLKTIIDNTENPAFKKQAQDKLNALKDKQNKRLAPPVQENMNIEFNNKGSNSNLFDVKPTEKDSVNTNKQPK